MLKSKDIACADCMHRGVCKYEDDLRKAQAAVDGVKISLGGELGEVTLHDLSWIAPVVLGCTHKRYDRGGVTIRSVE